ncbi:MAG: S49 family peptidase [Xanthobacteraceae bacterium]
MTAIDQRQVWSMLRAESQAWAIDPSRLDGMVALMARGERMAVPERGAATPSGIGVVPIVGPLTRAGGMLSEFFGFSSYSSIRSGLSQALADRSISRIILYVDSPGGAAAGCEELAADIAAAARVKPIAAYVDGVAASAAYWLASQAPQIAITPSGEVGSIGVLLLHMDVSRALDAAGVTPTFVVSKASPYKVEANQFEPLGAEASANLQSAVDKIAEKFIGAVARGRGVSGGKVRADYGKGRTLLAEAARAAGMIDRIGSLRDVIGDSATERRNLAAVRRQRIELESMTPQERLARARRRRLILEAQI